MLHLSVYKVLKSCILLGILLTLILKTWLICYSAEEDGFHPSESPDSNYDGNIDTIYHVHSTDQRGKQTGGKSNEETVTNIVNNITGASTMRHRGRSVGHVIAVTFWDQQTFSVGRLLSLQCWAAHHDMVVAEPFMINSKFGAPLTAEAMKHNDTMVRLGRLYDLDHWNEYSKKRGYAPMVEWKEFLHQAPRDVIIVKYQFPNRPVRSSLGGEYSRALAPHGFQVVREQLLECESWRYRLSMDDFTAHVFGNYSPSDVTVIFSEWTVIVNNIVDLASVHCNDAHTDYDVISPSKEISESAEAYIENQFGGGEYNAVMLRLEWMKDFSSCLQETIKRIDVMKNYTGVGSTFVAVDVGKYGSKSSGVLNSKSMVEPVQHFLMTIYENSSSLRDWEQTFEEISKNTSPGYIAFLQKVIATRAKCILITGRGAGTFQRHALSMYRELHSGTNDACYAVANLKCKVDTSHGISLH